MKKAYAVTGYEWLIDNDYESFESIVHYKDFFENASDVILFTDRKGIVVDVNSSVETVFGYKKKDIVGKPYSTIDIFKSKDAAKLITYVNTVQSGEHPGTLELETFHKSGTAKFVEIITRPIKDKAFVKGFASIIRDISERKFDEAIHRKNEEKFQMLFENANDGIVYLDNDGIIRASNKKIEELFGYSREAVIGKKFTEFEIFHPLDMNNTLNVFQESISGKLPPLLEFEGFHVNEKRFYLEINPTLIKEDEKILGLLAIIRDTTTRKVAEAERTRLIDIIEATPDFVLTYDVKGRISYINKAGREVTGHCVGDHTSDLGLPSLGHKPSLLVGDGFFKGETEFISPNKTVVNVSQVVMAHQRSEHDELCYSAIMRDISDQKQNERHIKNLSHQLMKIQEDERLRLSRELHDNLAQDLSSLKILCETLFDCTPDVSEILKKKIAEMSTICQRSIDSVRDLSYNLRPSSLDELGLVKTIYQYCKEFNDKNNIDVEFYSAGMKTINLTDDTEINLYRIVQEALNNIKKHAKADYVKVKLVSSYPTVILQIEDNGQGFDLQKRKKELVNEKRMGLKSIEERVGLLNGTFKIQSKKQLGTRIHVEVPLTELMPNDE